MFNEAYKFKAKVWEWAAEKGSWHFITLPVEIASEINFLFGDIKRGWGSIPVNVQIGDSEWKTSIFPDKKSNSFLMPLKASIRKAEDIRKDDEIEVILKVKG